jgi:hypothetical protein
MEEAIEALATSTGEWVELARWVVAESDYDADGWLDGWGERVGKGTAKLPGGGWVDLSQFAVVRRKADAA